MEVRTPCELLAELPCYFDFESEEVGSSASNSPFASCWYRFNLGYSYGGFPYVANSTLYNHTNGGRKGLYWYNVGIPLYYGDQQIAVLPQVDTSIIDVGRLLVSFWAKNGGGTMCPEVQVGIMTDPTDETTFQVAETFNVISSNWTHYEASTVGYLGTGSYVAIRALQPNDVDLYWHMYLDDVMLDDASDCSHVTNLHANHYATDSVTIVWTDLNPTAEECLVQYGPSGFALGDSNSVAMSVRGDTECTLVNLPFDSYYDVYVAARCGDGDTSRWEMLSFHTYCAPVDTLPYCYGFEDAEGSDISPCWFKGSNSVEFPNHPLPTYEAYSGSQSLAFTLTGTSYYQYAALPYFAHPLDSLQLRFKMRRSSTASYPYLCYSIKVGVMTDPWDINTFTEVGTYTATSDTVWDTFAVYFNDYHGVGHIAFRDANTYATYFTHLNIDDIVVDYLPTCAPIVHLEVLPAAHEATFSWSYAPVGRILGARVEVLDEETRDVSVDTVIGTRLTVTGLMPSRNYQLTVSPLCQEGGNAPVVKHFTTDTCTQHSQIPSGGVKEPLVQLYPNPTSGNVELILPETEGQVNVAIVDQSGRQLMHRLLPADTYRMTLPTAQLPQGTYYIRLITTRCQSTHKLVVR